MAEKLLIGGPPALRWRETYDPTVAYVSRDAVFIDGRSWRLKVVGPVTGVSPPTGASVPAEDATWALVADRGAVGPAGDSNSQVTVDQSLPAPANTGPIPSIVSWLAGAIKGITGETDWKNVPVATLKTLKTQVDSKLTAADLANTTDSAKGDALVGFAQAFSASVGRTLHDKIGEFVSATDFGVSMSAAVTTGSISAGSTSLTLAAAANFKTGHGLWVAGAGVGGANLIATITSISGVVVTLDTAASTTVTGVVVRHDDTAKLQALFDGIRTGAITARRIIAPEGTARLSNYISMGNLNDFVFVGAGASRTKFRQETANKPVFLFDDIPNGGRAFIFMRRMNLTHTNKPTDATDQQYGIQFRANADGTGLSSGGINLCGFEDMQFINCYDGIGVYSVTTGGVAVWGSTLRNLLFRATRRSAIRFRSATLPGGLPNLVLDNINVLNYSGVYEGAGVTNNGIAIDIQAPTGLVMNAINIEDWIDQAINVTGGGSATYNSLRFERHVMATNGVPIIYQASGSLTVNGMSLSSTKKNHTNRAYVFMGDASAKIAVNGLVESGTPSGTGILSAFESRNNATFIIENHSLLAGTDEYSPLSHEPTSQYGRLAVNGGPPKVEILPPASEAYRDRRFRLEGASGSADASYICLKQPNNSYAWTQQGGISIAQRPFDPKTMIHEYDDFVSGAPSAGSIGKLGWYSTNGTNSNLHGAVGRPGLLQRATGAVAGTYASLYLKSATTWQIFNSGDFFDITWIFRLSTFDADTGLRVGLANDAGANPPANGVYLEKLFADTSWFGVTRTASVETRTALGVASADWVRFRVRRVDASTVAFAINDGADVLVNTNIPSVGVGPFIAVVNNSAVSKTVDVDYFDMLLTGLAR